MNGEIRLEFAEVSRKFIECSQGVIWIKKDLEETKANEMDAVRCCTYTAKLSIFDNSRLELWMLVSNIVLSGAQSGYSMETGRCLNELPDILNMRLFIKLVESDIQNIAKVIDSEDGKTRYMRSLRGNVNDLINEIEEVLIRINKVSSPSEEK